MAKRSLSQIPLGPILQAGDIYLSSIGEQVFHIFVFMIGAICRPFEHFRIWANPVSIKSLDQSASFFFTDSSQCMDVVRHPF